jgi:hypothetical protein
LFALATTRKSFKPVMNSPESLGIRRTHLSPLGHLVGNTEASYLLEPYLAGMQMSLLAAFRLLS